MIRGLIIYVLLLILYMYVDPLIKHSLSLLCNDVIFLCDDIIIFPGSGYAKHRNTALTSLKSSSLQPRRI